jgi:hypothetical protein
MIELKKSVAEIKLYTQSEFLYDQILVASDTKALIFII